MFKKLDILIVRSFIGPFIVTFFVTLFVLVMQFFWLYMDELIGKGLGIGLILELLFFMSTTLVPMALPLAVLLASIMTFGNMGENYELVATKSAGISLIRIMRPLFIVMLVISGLAFMFSNNIIPVANLKAYTLLYDLRNSKLTVSIREGQFNNEITGYAIRVGKKDQDGKTIHNVMIYDNSEGIGNDKLILAKYGEMITTSDRRYLIFRLHDGWRYESNMSPGTPPDEKYAQYRMHFVKWDKVFDMSSFNKIKRSNEELFKGGQVMMNISQLNENIDSMKKFDYKTAENVKTFINPYLTIFSDTRDTLKKKVAGYRNPTAIIYKGNFLEIVDSSISRQVADMAATNIRNVKSLMEISSKDKEIKDDAMTNFLIEWHRKFSLSFACILLYLIGAPLGAIIRKGGIGLPLIIAVVFFVTYIIVSKTGEQLSKTHAIEPYIGMWLSTLMLLPFAFIFIQQARNDSRMFSKEWYYRNIGKVVRRISSLFKKKTLAS